MFYHEPILRSFLGCGSLLQIAFLPGYLLVRWRRWATGGLQSLILSFALSLLINFYLVVALVGLNLYDTPVLLALFGVELLLALVLFRPVGRDGIPPNWTSDVARLRRFGAALWDGDWLTRAARLVAVVWAGSALLHATRDIVNHWGDIFSVWDEVTSWNRWAMDWAGNGWPERTMSYPQLLPANLSLAYTFIDDRHLWTFAKGLMPLFPLAILLVPVDLALRTRRYGYVLAVPFLNLLIDTIIGPVRLLGYADGPLAFLVTAALYVCMLDTLEREPSESVGPGREYLVPILSAAAALTKATGWFAAAALALLTWAWHRRESGGNGTADAAPRAARRTHLGRWLALALLLPLPWYAFEELHLVSPLERHINMREVLVFSHRDRSPIARVTFGMRKLAENGHVPGMLALGLSLTALADRRWRWPAVLGFAWAGVWGFGMSYDTRNLAPALPFLGLAAGAGSLAAIKLRTRGRIAWVLVAGAMALAATYPADRLANAQVKQQGTIGLPEVNRYLLGYLRAPGIQGKILSNYNFMPYVPDLAGFYVHEYFHELESFKTNLRESKPHYLLYSVDWCDKDIQAFINERILSGEYALVVPIGHWNFVKVLR